MDKRLSPHYKRTKLKEFFKKRSPRKFLALNSKRENRTITGIRINKNGKPIL